MTKESNGGLRTDPGIGGMENAGLSTQFKELEARLLMSNALQVCLCPCGVYRCYYADNKESGCRCDLVDGLIAVDMWSNGVKYWRWEDGNWIQLDSPHGNSLRGGSE